MAKSRQMFVCRTCGGVQARWQGKCPDCGAWDALEEHRVDQAAVRDPQRGAAEAWAIEPADAGAEGGASATARAVARPIGEVGQGESVVSRLPTGIAELDRVLGGGLVPGSVTLIGGDPGIGKSTLMLQVAGALSGAGRADGAGEAGRVLYVTSEESADQLRLRAERLGVGGAAELFALAETNLARIIEQARRARPRIMVIDSIQMVYKADLDASPGSVAQLRRCCAELVYLAKLTGVAVILVGHVTKDGQLAGPRLLEHLVDTVLYFEGDRYHAHRIVRAIKNRFGSTLELGIFEMTGHGLAEVPSGLSVGALHGGAGAGAGGRPGSVICPVLAGSRCVLVEVQALTATGFLGAAKRKSSGLDPSRLAMLIAVLEQHAGLRLADRDIFASSVGGIRIAEPAADLALLLAIAGAHYKRGLAPGVAAVGEVGLGGEVRAVPQLGQRIREAQRLGFRQVIAPAAAARDRSLADGGAESIIAVRGIGEAIEQLG